MTKDFDTVSLNKVFPFRHAKSDCNQAYASYNFAGMASNWHTAPEISAHLEE
jgi:hypothetical protein